MANSRGANTLEYVDAINETYFEGKLIIQQCAEYRDHYSSGTVALSASTMASNSLASLSIVSHELGHARQDATGNTLKKHWNMRRAGRVCGLFFMPLLIAGAVLCVLNLLKVLPEILYLALGIGLWGLAALIFLFAIILKYNEIKIEKQASDFAIDYLAQVLSSDELETCREFLNSARLTYWASLIRTLLSWTMLTSKDKMFR